MNFEVGNFVVEVFVRWVVVLVIIIVMVVCGLVIVFVVGFGVVVYCRNEE